MSTSAGGIATGETAPEEPAPGPLPKPWVAGWASAFVPGGGFVYLHRYGTGAAYFGAETAELGATVAVLATSGYRADDPTTHDRANRILLPGIWLQDTHALGIYDAYRAARIARGNEGYWTPVPQPGLRGLLMAAVNGHTLVRPRVALPILATLAGGIAYSAWVRDHAPLDTPTFWENSRAPLFSREIPREQTAAAGMAYYGASFYMVGIGEEALFRGVLQSTFEEWWGTTPGLLAGSLVFGAAHFANDPAHPAAGLAQVGWTMLLGSYLGWMYIDDGHDLTASVALHTWYDFSVGLGYFLTDPRHQPFAARVTIPF